jgi:hypothetical protein
MAYKSLFDKKHARFKTQQEQLEYDIAWLYRECGLEDYKIKLQSTCNDVISTHKLFTTEIDALSKEYADTILNDGITIDMVERCFRRFAHDCSEKIKQLEKNTMEKMEQMQAEEQQVKEVMQDNIRDDDRKTSYRYTNKITEEEMAQVKAVMQAGSETSKKPAAKKAITRETSVAKKATVKAQAESNVGNSSDTVVEKADKAVKATKKASAKKATTKTAKAAVETVDAEAAKSIVASIQDTEDSATSNKSTKTNIIKGETTMKESVKELKEVTATKEVAEVTAVATEQSVEEVVTEIKPAKKATTRKTKAAAKKVADDKSADAVEEVKPAKKATRKAATKKAAVKAEPVEEAVVADVQNVEATPVVEPAPVAVAEEVAPVEVAVEAATAASPTANTIPDSVLSSTTLNKIMGCLESKGFPVYNFINMKAEFAQAALAHNFGAIHNLAYSVDSKKAKQFDKDMKAFVVQYNQLFDAMSAKGVKAINAHQPEYPNSFHNKLGLDKAVPQIFVIGDESLLNNHKTVGLTSKPVASERGKIAQKLIAASMCGLRCKDIDVVAVSALNSESCIDAVHAQLFSGNKVIVVIPYSFTNVQKIKPINDLLENVVKAGGCVVSIVGLGVTIKPNNMELCNTAVAALSDGMINTETQFGFKKVRNNVSNKYEYVADIVDYSRYINGKARQLNKRVAYVVYDDNYYNSLTEVEKKAAKLFESSSPFIKLHSSKEVVNYLMR